MKVREMAKLISRVEPDIKEWLESKAEKQDRSLNWLIRNVLREAKERDEQLLQA